MDDHGEIAEACAACAPLVDELRAQLAGSEREVRSLRTRISKLERNEREEAEADALWPVARELHELWAGECNHPRCTFDLEQYKLIAPFLRRRNCGVEACERAIAGARFDCFTHMRKNGTTHRCDEFERIFGDSKHFYEFCNRAPRGWLPRGKRKGDRDKADGADAGDSRQETLDG